MNIFDEPPLEGEPYVDAGPVLTAPYKIQYMGKTYTTRDGGDMEVIMYSLVLDFYVRSGY